MSLTELETAAALAEQVYRRADQDQQLTDLQIGVSQRASSRERNRRYQQRLHGYDSNL
jgi:hypothetical protein